jgi:FKBP-type peptidyl-prolyl cis-trans isomerase SlyD
MNIVALAAGVLLLASGVARAQPKERTVSPAVENGSVVQLEYTLKDETGKVLDSNKGRDPLTYTQGERQIIPGLEQAVNGMRSGDEKRVTVKPEDAYGPLDPSAQVEVPKQVIPPDALAVGTQLLVTNPEGRTQVVQVKEVKKTTVIIDLNHALAGKTLFFDVKVMGVAPPKK